MNAAIATLRGTWAQAAEDLRTLSWLHAAERSCAVWLALGEAGLPNGLVLVPAGDASLVLMTEALAGLAVCHRQDAQACNDELAADYAAIYLTHALRASPCESVWRDEDHLMRQGPTFAVRETYRRHGLAVQDPRGLADDHLSHELDFVAELLARGECAAAQAFLDEHLLAWGPDCLAELAAAAATDYYQGMALLGLGTLAQARAHWDGGAPPRP
jgi:putative dimethyl sulfoxide reductase chaperone